MIKKGKKGKHQYFFGILKRFQGLGFVLSTDNPITINDYFLFEVRFLWLKFWYCYELSKWRSF
jgi:hypothetical protein